MGLPGGDRAALDGNEISRGERAAHQKKTQALENGKARLKQVCADGKAAERWNRLEQDLLVLFRDEPTDAGRWRQGPHQERLLGHSDAAGIFDRQGTRRRDEQAIYKDGVALKEDERFQKYFKMLSRVCQRKQ